MCSTLKGYLFFLWVGLRRGSFKSVANAMAFKTQLKCGTKYLVVIPIQSFHAMVGPSRSLAVSNFFVSSFFV